MNKQLEILERALQREKAARKQAEEILEQKAAELYDISVELRKSNQQLEKLYKKQSFKLKGVFDNLSDAYMIMDFDGNVIEMNEASKKVFGYDIDVEEFNVLQLFLIKDLDVAYQTFDHLYTNGQFANYTTRIRTKDASIKWIHVNASLMYDENNNPIAAQGIIRDITSQKVASEIIEEQKKELEIIVENAPFGIGLSMGNTIIKTNKTLQDMLGYSAEEFLNIGVERITHFNPPEYHEYTQLMEQQQLDSFSIEKSYFHKNGSIVWAKTTINALRDNDGDVKFRLSIIQDITSEREKNKSITLINEVAKAILGKVDLHEIAWEIVSNIAHYLETEDCVIYLLDKREAELRQIAAFGNKAIGKTIANEITIPLGKGIVGSVAEKGIPELIHNTAEDPRYIEDDDIRFSEITVPIFYNEEVIGVIDSEHPDKNFYTDIHLKTLQNIARLVALQIHNAIILDDKTKAEAKNQILLQELEKSNQELEEYAHVVSHDLKSPLRSIDALVHWIMEDNAEILDDNTKGNFTLIQKTLEKMEQLISGILQYSSVSNGYDEFTFVDTHELVSTLLEILYVPPSITIDISGTLPKVKGDKTKLQQVFQNLISNAIKFNDKDKGVIEICAEEKETHFQFTIKDNGMGIERKYFKTIFKIFNSLQSRKDSSGIGLSIVKKVIELHHGEIWLESTPSEGSTFYFTIKK